MKEGDYLLETNCYSDHQYISKVLTVKGNQITTKLIANNPNIGYYTKGFKLNNKTFYIDPKPTTEQGIIKDKNTTVYATMQYKYRILTKKEVTTVLVGLI